MPEPRPYAEAALIYYRAGFPGVLPVKGKWPPPTGWTGTNGAWPSYPDVMAWIEGDEGKLNIGLRLPRHVIGIDVDDYGTKTGGRTLADHEELWGPLPPTWISTSRGDGVSGIRLFTVPEGLHWPGELRGGGVEIIQYKHRYVMCWPSIHPDTGRMYGWAGASWPLATAAGWPASGNGVPNAGELPNLPQAWIDGLTQGKSATDVEKADLGDAQAALWLTQHGGQERQCPAMIRAVERCREELSAPGASRHDVTMRGVARITHLLTEGHHGAMAALSAVHGAFAAAVNDPSRSGEWGRLITGAVQIAAVHQPAPFDPCISPFIAGHVPSSPLRQERTSWDTSPISASSAPAAGTPASSSTSPTPVVALAPVVSMIPETTTVGTITALPMAASAPDATPAGQPSSIGLLTPGTPARTSWWPVDLSRILNGEHAEEAPEVLRRDDGAALFYLGRVNGLIGPSESGKSWVALAACAQELLDGHHVTYLDFEDTASGVVRRVLGMGVPPDVIAERFHYIGPDESPAPEALADLTATLTEHSPRLVVLDGFNAAMSLAGLELMSNTDATVFFQRLLNPIMRSDRAIVYVDHVPKSKIDESSGGIGAQAKRAMTTGCTIRVDKKDEFGPGVTGYLKLTIDKDRMGHVREVAIGAKFAGTAVIDSAHGLMTITIEKPVSEVEVETKREARRHPDVMQQISELLAIAPEGLSKNVVRKEVTAGNPAIEAALRDLLSEGYIEQSTGSRSAIICKNVRPFRADSDIRFTAFDPTSPDLARPRPDLAPGDVPSRVSYVARPPRPDPYVVGSGGARSEPDGAGAANTENEHLAPGEVDETDLTWRDGNLVNKRTGEIVRRRA